VSRDPGGPNKTDAKIIRLLRRGTEEDIARATELTVKQYDTRIKRFLLATFPHVQHQDAEDIAQQTIQALLRKAAKGELNDEGSFVSLLFTIAECFAISLWRANTRHKVDGTIDVADVARARYDAPHKLDELQRALRKAIEKKLSLREREVLDAHLNFVAEDGHEPSWEELAAIIEGGPVTEQQIDAIKHTYYRAIVKLESCFKIPKLRP
jgi:DNA-directed RNA polymerase specialized sigma24 family protein